MRDVVYLVIICVLLVLGLIILDSKDEWKEKAKQKDSIIAEKNDTIRYHKNESGRIVAEKNAALASSKEIAKAYPQLEKELKEDFDIKIKNLKTYIRNEIIASGGGKASVTNNYIIDSAGNKVEYRDVKFDDGYLKFESLVFEGLDFGESKYTYQDTITTAIHAKKNWIFGRERLLAVSSLRNPAARVSATTNILVDNYRDKRFCIYVGPGYDFLNNKMTINVGVGYAIFKF